MFLSKFKYKNTNLLKIIILSSSLYLISFYFFVSQGLQPILIIRDLGQIYNAHIGEGFISTIGIYLWITTSAICFFSSLPRLINNKKYRNFIFNGGIFSFILGIDDLFLIHDRYIKEEYIYFIYIFSILLFFYKYIKQIYSCNLSTFFSAIIFLGTSLLVDQFQSYLPLEYITVQFFEEGLKFVGISCWLLFWASTAFTLIKQRT